MFAQKLFSKTVFILLFLNRVKNITHFIIFDIIFMQFFFVKIDYL